MNSHSGVDNIIIVDIMSGDCGMGSIFYTKKVAMESVNDSIFGLGYIFYVASLVFQAVHQIVTLASTIEYGVVEFFVR